MLLIQESWRSLSYIRKSENSVVVYLSSIVEFSIQNNSASLISSSYTAFSLFTSGFSEIVCEFLYFMTEKFEVLISWDNSFEFSVDVANPLRSV
jgi:hypothetical protein